MFATLCTLVPELAALDYSILDACINRVGRLGNRRCRASISPELFPMEIQLPGELSKRLDVREFEMPLINFKLLYLGKFPLKSACV